MDHKITLTGQNPTSDNMSFTSDIFQYNTATQPLMMNDTGFFSYYEADVNDEDPDFVMKGTINVVDQPDGKNKAFQELRKKAANNKFHNNG